jgi:hypothetical protein
LRHRGASITFVRGRYYFWTPPSECHNSLKK